LINTKVVNLVTKESSFLNVIETVDLKDFFSLVKRTFSEISFINQQDIQLLY